MVTWSKPPEEELHDALSKVWNSLDNEVIGDPSFDAVVGISPSRLTQHAVQAVSAYISAEKVSEFSAASLIHVYTLGFVVGAKYGEVRAERALRDQIT